jgi:sortase A
VKSGRALAGLYMAMGGACLLGGLTLIGLQALAPESAPQLLARFSPSPPEPTQGYLFNTPLAPPPMQANLVLMPQMALQAEVASLNTPLPSPTPPSPSLIALASPSPRSSLSPSPLPPTSSPSSPGRSANLFITPTASPSPPPPSPSPSATLMPRLPARIEIPSIHLEAPIQEVWLGQVAIGGEVYSQWQVPSGRTVGWHQGSARLGEVGNTVLNGHHNVEGRVFEDLIAVQAGDGLILAAPDGFRREYTVVQTMLLPEEGRPLEERLENARWLLPSSDERITLVTCWPPDGRTHRLLVVALPSEQVPRP